MSLPQSAKPLLIFCALGLVAEAAHAVGALVIVDNTFASPMLQKPMKMGADVVVQSATK